MHEKHGNQIITFAAANLVQNYRSHTTLLEIPNTLFYQGTLVASADQSQLLPPRWTELEDQSQAITPPPTTAFQPAILSLHNTPSSSLNMAKLSNLCYYSLAGRIAVARAEP